MKELIVFALPSPLPGYGGWGNGYVALPKEHPYYGITYYDIDDIDVHGGLTYSEKHQPDRDPIETKDMWILGFDTLHLGDSPQRWPDEQSVLKEANNLKSQLLAINAP